MQLRFTCLALLVACGSSHSDWVPSDVDTDQTLDRLGDSGYARVCSAFEDYVRDQYRSNYLIKAACTADALVGGRGNAGKIVEAARAQDRGDFDRVAATGISSQAIFVAWYEAVRWTEDLLSHL